MEKKYIKYKTKYLSVKQKLYGGLDLRKDSKEHQKHLADMISNDFPPDVAKIILEYTDEVLPFKISYMKAIDQIKNHYKDEIGDQKIDLDKIIKDLTDLRDTFGDDGSIDKKVWNDIPSITIKQILNNIMVHIFGYVGFDMIQHRGRYGHNTPSIPTIWDVTTKVPISAIFFSMVPPINTKLYLVRKS